MPDDNELTQNLKLLSQEFITALPEQLGTIETNWVRVRRNGWDPVAVHTLVRQLHALAGTAATLGFEEIAQNASRLQTLLGAKNNGNGRAESEALLSKAESEMQVLRQAVYTDQQVDLAELTQRLALAKASSTSLQEKRADRLIYMVEDDSTQAAELAEQISYFGYSVKSFHNPDALEDAIRQAPPRALLMDVSFPEGKMWGYETITRLREEFPDLPPILFITINDQMAFRLQAVRVGGEAYFTKPVDVVALIDFLDRLIFQDIFPPSRVLIVDDSRVQANYIALQLKKVGIITEVATDPLKVIDQMISFTPDLVLLDMYMPECTGMELAKVIRQMEQFISIPIVFLSAETDKDKQIAAMGQGGDDFLTKPLAPEHLISAVTTRIERYRKLRALMIHDGLTGLLNHSTTKDRLVQEIEHARKRNLPLSLAMIDLDHFKIVNDSYGHATGDRVLKSLAYMLKQRLRGGDTIGRIGGEEFAILLPNTDEKTAARVMSELCEGFAHVHHYSGEKEFYVSFSCGVATYPEYGSAAELSKAADEALYAAKAAGRNQVRRASEARGGMESMAEKIAAQSWPAAGPALPVPERDLVRLANSAILRIDARGTITFVNEFAQHFFGYSKEELAGQPLVGTLVAGTAANQADLQTMLTNIASNPDGYLHRKGETTLKDGEKVWMAWSNTPLLDEEGRLTEILCIGHDITGARRTEADLKRTLSSLSALNRISQAVMSQQDLPSIVSGVAGEVVDLFDAQHIGISLLNDDQDTIEFIGNSHEGWNISPGVANRIYLPDDPASEQVIRTGKSTFVSQAMTSPLTRGSHVVLKAHGIHGRMIVPLITRGKTIGTMNIDFESPERRVSEADFELADTIAGSVASVIENRRLLSAEQSQREYYEALLRNIPVAVVTIDAQSKIRSWNPAAEKLFGYTAAETNGQDIDDLLTSDEYRQEGSSFTQNTLDKGRLIHAITRRRRKDGSQAEVELLAVPVIVNGEQLASLAIYHDITDLQRARREAEAANEAKSAFLATMSHEIRTPLNAIVGMTTLLLDTPLTDEQKEFSETIRTSSDALLTIINDILDFSKIEAGRMELEEQAFDLRQCVESALDLVAAKAAEKGIDLAYLLEAGVPPVIVSDSTRLRQILLNLLSNALKFTNEGEVVLTIAAQKVEESEGEDYQLHFSVRDTGIGIAPERRDLLFRSFSQLDASTTRKFGGTGLGLAISKRLAELMRGSMWAESEGIPGKGSTFHFTIQARQSTSPVPVFLHVKQPELSGKRVLIVDDNATNRYILMRQVQVWGMAPQETASPRQALEWIRQGQRFDLALLDMQMPEMDGITLASEITDCLEKPDDLPMIMLTSLGLKEMDATGVKFAAYLTKPIKPGALHTALLKVFKGRPTAIRHEVELPVGEPPVEELAPLHILLAEDTLVNQKVALHLLQRIGYRVDVAGNGLEVLEALRRQPYDVILMDVQMPEMDGLEATRQVRKGAWQDADSGDRLKGQPYIIAMTANAMQGDREICLAAGMDDYISKPIRLEELRGALSQAARVIRSRAKPDDGWLPVEGPPKEDAIDERTFRRFHATLGEDDPEAMTSLIRDYLEEAPRLLAEIKEAGECGEFQALRRGAHSLKSSSELFGATQLVELCRSLESSVALENGGARENKAQELTTQVAAEMVVKIEREFEEVRQVLLVREHMLQK
jgi:diguanylate cyclase (GGDEF)-like protein/PAS domain S-box-containing protein